MQVPELRDQIARCSAAAPNGVTGEQYLELFDKAFAPEVLLKVVVEVVAPLYARWDIGTGKSRSVVLPLPPGRVIVAALCWLAGGGRALKQVRQAEDGCVLEPRPPLGPVLPSCLLLGAVLFLGLLPVGPGPGPVGQPAAPAGRGSDAPRRAAPSRSWSCTGAPAHANSFSRAAAVMATTAGCLSFLSTEMA
jgi:hypothetical protein